MKPTLSILLLLVALTSCSTGSNEETIIKNSIASEAQLQKMNLLLYEEGAEYPRNILQELSITSSENPEKTNRLSEIFQQMTAVEAITIKLIYSIDQLKISILKKNNVSQKIQFEYSICPRSLDLKKFKNLSDTGIPSQHLINPDGKTPSKKGFELFNHYKTYRNELVKIVGSTKDQKMMVTDINDYKSEEDLLEKIEQQISSKAPNYRDDQALLTDLYKLLTLPDQVDGKHWILNTFEHSNLIGCISTLTILQNNILQARALALAHISSKISSCNYGFDKIIPFAQGPSVIHEGESAKITVGVAAFDSYNYPEVTVESASGEIINPENGTGIVIIKPKKGIQKIKGTVSIRNRSGIKRTEGWEWDIHVLPKK